MRHLLNRAAAALLLTATAAFANEDLTSRIDDSKQWAIQTGDYANTRYSELDQITKDND